MSARCHLSDNAIVRKKDINSIDAFINTYAFFLCILYKFSYIEMKFAKSFHFYFI